MNPRTIMIVAGEASGDMLAAELVRALRARPAGPGHLGEAFEPRFFGAGGSHMQQAGVELDFDLTRHSVIGLWEVLKDYGRYKKLFQRLVRLAVERQPDAIIGVDFSGFNRRLAAAIKGIAQSGLSMFTNWNPKLIQFVSPQVWASRPGRARRMARYYDLVLSIFPFEVEWYARHAPHLPVRFVGHPMLDRYACYPGRGPCPPRPASVPPRILLLPGSRAAELKRHLPVMLGALALMRKAHPDLQARAILPNETLAAQALGISAVRSGVSDAGLTASHAAPGSLGTMVLAPSAACAPISNPPVSDGVSYQVGQLPEALLEADLAIASTGTVTMECAYFCVPTVAIYKTSWSTYHIGKRIVRVRHLAMPNIMAGRAILPELVQEEATEERIAKEALDVLAQPERQQAIRRDLAQVITSLGPPGACQRAAYWINQLIMAPNHLPPLLQEDSAVRARRFLGKKI